MEVAYVAQTESCMFLLDGDGFCRASVPSGDADDAARKVARRCVGAQYVASLDHDAEGLLASDPRPGCALLFAKVGPEGRVALIRTAALVELHALDGDEPMPRSLEPDLPIVLDEEPEEPAEQDDDCMELTAPFAREHTVDAEEDGLPTSAVMAIAPKAKVAVERDSAPETMRAPQTVRGFPPPPPLAIASRRGMLPRRRDVN